MKFPDFPDLNSIKGVISSMTLQEKCSQLLHKSPALSRLNIPSYDWWSEALHGSARAGKATVFPQVIGLAAMFDRQMVKKIASMISDEVRAKYNEAQKIGNSGRNCGLTVWSPNVNIFRDPRWGRGQETWGEDPFLTGELASEFISGMQESRSGRMKTAACAKHFAVHNGPEADRHEFNARVSLKDLHETYLPAFRKCVQKGVEAVMGAYNRTNDEPCCASPYLLKQVLRGQWGFKGHVVSDCGALGDIHKHHRLTGSESESAALALKNGCDLNCGNVYRALPEAVEKGLLNEEDIDQALIRLYTTRLKLGMFDDPDKDLWKDLDATVIASAKHAQAAYQAAARSIVLLKNANSLLPLKHGIKRIYVTGPNAADIEVLLGNYYGVNDRLVSYLEGVTGRAEPGVAVEYRRGCLLDRRKLNPTDWAVGDAKNFDVIIACMGIHPIMEGEEGDALLSSFKGDRNSICLPYHQTDFLKRLKETGKPVALVLSGGGAMDISSVLDDVDAVLMAWYPGQEGGNALADIIFGNVNPSGRLPVTFPYEHQLPPFDDYSMQNRTYRYLKEEPLFPFGFGLSYARSEFTSLKMGKNRIPIGEPVRFSLKVRNAGTCSSEEIVQIYLTDPDRGIPLPLNRLVDFYRIPLKAGEEKTLQCTLEPEVLQWINDQGESCSAPGEYLLTAGGCSPGKRGVELGASKNLHAFFSLY